LPDGLFSFQKSQFVYILENFGMENVGIFYEILEYFMAIWYILWQFGIFYGNLVYFMAIWYSLWLIGICIFLVLVCLDQEKSGNPG
jgi:hypothetical protein